MKKAEVQIGEHYIAKVSGKLTVVQIHEEATNGGWHAINLTTGHGVRIRSAARLRYPARDRTPRVQDIVTSLHTE